MVAVPYIDNGDNQVHDLVGSVVHNLRSLSLYPDVVHAGGCSFSNFALLLFFY